MSTSGLATLITAIAGLIAALTAAIYAFKAHGVVKDTNAKVTASIQTPPKDTTTGGPSVSTTGGPSV